MKTFLIYACAAAAMSLGACSPQGSRKMSAFERGAAYSDTMSDYNRLVGDLRGELREGEVEIAALEKRLSIEIASTLFFDSGKDELKESAYPLLLRLAKGLKKLEGKRFQVEGHADDIPIGKSLQGEFETNWELSASRAVKVTRFLQEKGGIDPRLLMAVGMGSHTPVMSNATSKGRRRNRRMEIVIVNSHAEN